MREPIGPSEIIELLRLEPLPQEGGYYKETYRASDALNPQDLPRGFYSPRNLSTAIYYFLTSETFSAFHRLKSDEIFHFYLGDPVRMYQLHHDGSSREIILGTD